MLQCVQRDGCLGVGYRPTRTKSGIVFLKKKEKRARYSGVRVLAGFIVMTVCYLPTGMAL